MSNPSLPVSADSVDEVPLVALPLYGDPERTDPLLPPTPRPLFAPEGELERDDDTMSIVPLTRPMTRPVWARDARPGLADLRPLLAPATYGTMAGFVAAMAVWVATTLF